MKAVAVFPGSQQVKIIEQDVPRLTQPDQVALRLLDVGICGTDKEICSFAYGTPPPGDDYLVIGHESLAEISRRSDGTTFMYRSWSTTYSAM